MAFNAEALSIPLQPFNENMKLLHKPTPDNTYIHTMDPEVC